MSSRYLGNNFWEFDDGKILNTKTGIFSNKEDFPATIKFRKSIENYELIEETNFHEMENGKRFIMFDFCEKIRRHGKTTYVEFLKFNTIDITTRKYHSLRHINNGFHKFKHYFVEKGSYILACEINHEFPDHLHILKSKQLFKGR